MKTLIITAHPSKFGFTHRIAERYAKGAQEKGNEVEILDLYAEENRQNFLEFENIKEIPADPSVNAMQQKISASNELVFIFPLWWFAEPAIMKNFWDKNMTARFAYQYGSNGRPQGLLKGKTAKVFVTADGPKIFHYLLLNPVKKIWKTARLGFCGIKLESYMLIDEMLKRDVQNRESVLDDIYNIAKS
jgi:putative NADPH-quinone reductase